MQVLGLSFDKVPIASMHEIYHLNIFGSFFLLLYRILSITLRETRIFNYAKPSNFSTLEYLFAEIVTIQTYDTIKIYWLLRDSYSLGP